MMVSQSKATYVYLIIAYHIYDDGIFAGLTDCVDSPVCSTNMSGISACSSPEKTALRKFDQSRFN